MTSNPRILIIDDNVNLAHGFAVALRREGYDVAIAHTADDGLRLAREQEPDAILLDFRMPFVNGVGFLYRLRSIPSLGNVPVMVITGATVNDETRQDLRDLRAALRFKPLALADLVESTRALLDGLADAPERAELFCGETQTPLELSPRPSSRFESNR